jgi:hypothetical protein
VTAAEPAQFIPLMTALLGRGYTHYTLVDTTSKNATRTETRQTNDARFNYKLTITMGAQVEDPIAYLHDFNPDASIFDAFYPELVEGIALELSACEPQGLSAAQKDMTAYAEDIKQRQPQHRGVRIQLFAVRLDYGDELALRIRTLDRLAMFNKFGESYFAAEAAADPSREQLNTEVIRKFRETRTHEENHRLEMIGRGLDLLERTSELTGESVAKLIRESGLQTALKDMFPPAPQVRRVTKVSVSEIIYDPNEDGVNQAKKAE